MEVTKMDELWNSIKEMEPSLGDANKPLAIAASYALLKGDNEKLTRERNALDAALRERDKQILALRERHIAANDEVFRLAELLRKADPMWGSPMHLNAARGQGAAANAPETPSVNQAVFGSANQPEPTAQSETTRDCVYVKGCAYLAHEDCIRAKKCLGGWPFPEEPIDERTPRQARDGTDI